MMMDIFRKKDVSKSRTGMKRHLKIHDLILLGIGAMVGTGIFTITGIGAANYAGPSLIISIIISALCVSMSALFYAEFSSGLFSKHPIQHQCNAVFFIRGGDFFAGCLIALEALLMINILCTSLRLYGRSLALKLVISLSCPFPIALYSRLKFVRA